MEIATRSRRAVAPSDASRAPMASRLLAAAAGPALIVVSVLIALRGIAFLPHLSDQHPDVLTFWLPRSCMLGRALAEGRVPLWNPFEMAGTPFAADPQGGWLSLPTMALSWLFGCGGGLRALIVLNPILAGLGMRWFLRKEGIGRIAATAGGLSLAMGVSASIVAVSLPFAGTLAWTPYVLTGASGYFSGAGWRRLGWLALAAFAWGQVATSHLSHGLLMATGLCVAYVAARAIHEARAGRLQAATALALSAGFLAFLPLSNLAILVPRFAVLMRSSLAGGYGAFEGTVAGVPRSPEKVPIPTTGIWGAWPLAFASTPGGYLGAGILLFVPLAVRDAARRFLVLALVVVGVVGYMLTGTLLVGASWFRSFALALPFGDVYLHNPARLRYLAFLLVPALGAVGLQWILDRRPRLVDAMRWIAIGLAIFLLIPLIAGARPQRLIVFALASAAVLGVVVALVRGRRWAPIALCSVLAAELVAGAVWSSTYRGGTVYLGLETGNHPALVAAPLRWPDVDLDRYLEPGPIALALQEAGPSDGRYLAWIPPDAYFNKGYLFTRSAADWPALLIGRSILFEVPDALGYSPVQLPGYWSFIRATNRLPVFYNASVLQVPTLGDVRLLGVRFLVAREGVPLPAGISGDPVTEEGAYRLLEIGGAEPRVSVVPAWGVVPEAAAALEAVTSPGFDPAVIAVLETEPGLSEPRSGSAGFATYDQLRPEDVRVRVRAPASSIVLIRNAWDEGWSATLDGRPARVLRTDGFMQGIAVGAGAHEIRLTYREPSIGKGLALSGVVWMGFLAILVLSLARLRRMDRAPEGGPRGRSVPTASGGTGEGSEPT